MSNRDEIKVTDCRGCPFVRAPQDFGGHPVAWTCVAVRWRTFAHEEAGPPPVPPDWCPLQRGDVGVGLLTPDSETAREEV